MKTYKRMEKISTYLFCELDKLKSNLLKNGYDLLDLSIGDPDLPTPDFIINALKNGAEDKLNHRYPPYEGSLEFRNAVAYYYKRRFNVELDAENEIITLIGSKEGLSHLCMALVDTDDPVIVPEPSYPVYRSSVYIAGGRPIILRLNEKSNYLPDLSQLDQETAKRVKIMYINYPNNPTGTVCDKDFYKQLINFASSNSIVIVNDSAYNEIVFDREPISIMEVEGALETAVEVGTLSKSYNMTGWRIGYAVGSRDIIKKLSIFKSNIDSGQFGAIQHAGAVALNNGDKYISSLREIYKNRRDLAGEYLKNAGINFVLSRGSFYIWYKIPYNMNSLDYAYKLAVESGVLVTPGIAFGDSGEGFCRLSLTADESVIKRAIERISYSNLGK